MNDNMNNNIKFIGLGLVAAFALTSCSDDFLWEKKNYDNVSADAYNYVSGCNLHIHHY